MKQLGQRIRTLRRERGLTQEDVVVQLQLLGHGRMSQPRQAEIEAGRREVTVAEAISFARIFGIPVEELLKGLGPDT